MSDDSGQDVVNLEVCVLHIRNVGRAALLEGDESDCPILSWVRTSVRKGKQKHAADSNVILCFSSPLVKVLLFPSSHYSSSPPSSSPSSSFPPSFLPPPSSFLPSSSSLLLPPHPPHPPCPPHPPHPAHPRARTYCFALGAPPP